MLKFVSIKSNELVQGSKYKIEEKSYYYLRTFIGTYNGQVFEFNGGEHLMWKKLSFAAEHMTEQNVIKRSYFEHFQMNITSIYERQIYKLVSLKEQIQNVMEQRAIKTILQNIIGDPKFCY